MLLPENRKYSNIIGFNTSICTEWCGRRMKGNVGGASESILRDGKLHSRLLFVKNCIENNPHYLGVNISKTSIKRKKRQEKRSGSCIRPTSDREYNKQICTAYICIHRQLRATQSL